MEALVARRLCNACLGQLLNSRNISYQMFSRSLHKPFPSVASVIRSSRRNNRVLPTTSTYSYRLYATQKGKTADTGKKKVNLVDELDKGDGDGGSKTPWIVAGLVCLFGVAYTALKLQKNQIEKELLEKQPIPLIKLSVGGPWELVSHDNQRMSNKDFLGQWHLLYFGFTHCPDICPDELEKIVKAVNIVDNNKEIPNVKPLFVTIDEERDTQPIIKSYLAEFSPKLLGFTGTSEEIETIKKAYRIYSSKGPTDSDGDYIDEYECDMKMSGKEKLRFWLNKSLKIEMTDGRTLIGVFLCTDRDRNVILGSCEEYLKPPDKAEKKEEPRILGLAMIPGHHIVSIHVDADRGVPAQIL